MLKENLAKVEENIQAACDRAGRKREEVTLFESFLVFFVLILES